MPRAPTWVTTLLALVAASSAQGAVEDIDFVAEHLSEVSMDSRLLTLPIWSTGEARAGQVDWLLDGGYQRITTGGLSLSGASLGIGVRRAIGDSWAVGALAVWDRSSFDGGDPNRPVAPIFSDNIPLDLPADAVLTNLRGDVEQTGGGVTLSWRPAQRRFVLVGALLYFKVQQQGYRVDYTLTSGASTGTSGTLDYSSSFDFIIPTGGIEWQWQAGRWNFAPRLQAGIPLPRYGWRGRITGPGFDVAGDTDDIGRGKHMGDAFAGVGLGVTYEPWQLTVDVGTLLNQVLLEPRLHKGISRAWTLHFRWQPRLSRKG